MIACVPGCMLNLKQWGPGPSPDIRGIKPSGLTGLRTSAVAFVRENMS